MRRNYSFTYALLIAFAITAGESVYAQFAPNTVRFANDRFSGINAPFYDVDGITRLAGSTFRAALYWAPEGFSPELMVQVGLSVPFTINGFWMSADRQLPASAGDTAILQVRFWDSVGGAYPFFEQAEANGARIGVSIPIVVTLNPPQALIYLTGLQSAGLVPTITLTRGTPGLFTDSGTVANGSQFTNLCSVPVGLNRWFRLTSPYAGEAMVTTAGSSIDTVAGAYTGSIISPSTLALITCNDNRSPGATASELSFQMEANKLYLLCVAGKNGASGTIRINHSLLTYLRVRRYNSEQIELSWPADATDFIAEATSEFPAIWRTITNTPVVITNRKVVYVDCAAAHEMYRLRLP